MYKEIFCVRLKDMRKEYDISQQKIADEIGVDKSCISKYESGKLQPNIETLGKIAVYLNVSTDWLLGLGK